MNKVLAVLCAFLFTTGCISGGRAQPQALQSVSKVIIAYPDSTVGLCSATVVSEKIAISAAHCFISPHSSQITLLYPGLNRVTEEPVLVSEVFIEDCYLPDGNPECDFAILYLATEVRPPYLIPKVAYDSNIEITTVGYPGESSVRVEGKGSVFAITDDLIHHDNVTLTGMSGGAITDGTFIYGVITTRSPTFASGVRFTEQRLSVLRKIIRWAKEEQAKKRVQDLSEK